MWLDLIAEPGEDILEACTTACKVSKKLGITVWFKFNEVSIHANEDTIPSKMVEDYKIELSSEHPNKVI